MDRQTAREDAHKLRWPAGQARRREPVERQMGDERRTDYAPGDQQH